MNKIKRLWNSVSGRLALLAEGDKQVEDTTASELRRMLQRCPVCGGDFENHDYAHFAVTVFVEEKGRRVKEFFEACEERRWEDAKRFQEFDPAHDAIVAYALRCATNRLAFVVERNPSELYEADRVIACDVLDEASGQRLERLIAQNDWRRLSWI